MFLLPHFPFVCFLCLQILIANAQRDRALQCKEHPAGEGIQSVLISSWDFDQSSTEVEQVTYLARYRGHKYAPVEDLASDLYNGLDLFHTADFTNLPSIRIFFQRPAKVYLFVNVEEADFNPEVSAVLRGGWNSVGWAQRVLGEGTIVYGIHQTISREMSKYVYVFQKHTGGKAFLDLPQAKFVKKRTSFATAGPRISLTGRFNLWIAEADGTASPDPGPFQGSVILPNTVCPKGLHDAWMVTKSGDPSVADVKFTSWHPQWDPCWWCAYDHEHGSDPRILKHMPAFTYTALKNAEEMETDEGFKGFTVRVGQYYFYYSIHVHQSQLRRLSIRNHTINIVIYDRSADEIVADFSHKGDFGFESVKLSDGSFAPFTPEGTQIRDFQKANGLPNKFRSINVIDLDNLDEGFSYRKPPIIGQYEFWETLPMCAKPKNSRAMLSTVFKRPNIGIRTVANLDHIVFLGLPTAGKFYRNLGLNRSFRVGKMQFGQEFCPLDPATSQAASGVFYTNPAGDMVLPGPGPNAVRQYFKEGFKIVLSGRFEVVDRDSGEHQKGARGFFLDHGYGIDPDKN